VVGLSGGLRPAQDSDKIIFTRIFQPDKKKFIFSLDLAPWCVCVYVCMCVCVCVCVCVVVCLCVCGVWIMVASSTIVDVFNVIFIVTV